MGSATSQDLSIEVFAWANCEQLDRVRLAATRLNASVCLGDSTADGAKNYVKIFFQTTPATSPPSHDNDWLQRAAQRTWDAFIKAGVEFVPVDSNRTTRTYPPRLVFRIGDTHPPRLPVMIRIVHHPHAECNPLAFKPEIILGRVWVTHWESLREASAHLSRWHKLPLAELSFSPEINSLYRFALKD